MAFGRSGQRFFSSVSGGVFNLVTSFTQLKEFVQLHPVLQSNKACNSQWEGNLRQYTRCIGPLFNVFTSKDALRWVLFVRNIDARDWELHLRDPESGSFIQAYEAGEQGIVKVWWREHRWT